MPSWAAWIVAIPFCLMVGAVTGVVTAKESTRSEIANECRHAGAFTNKRTGFECRPIKKVAQ